MHQSKIYIAGLEGCKSTRWFGCVTPIILVNELRQDNNLRFCASRQGYLTEPGPYVHSNPVHGFVVASLNFQVLPMIQFHFHSRNVEKFLNELIYYYLLLQSLYSSSYITHGLTYNKQSNMRHVNHTNMLRKYNNQIE